MSSSSNCKILRRCSHFSSSSAAPADWSTLPPDLVQSLVSDLQSLADYIRFRSVCRSWNAVVGIDRRLLPRELPWLMLPFTSSSDHQYRGFFNPFTNAHQRLFLPEVSPNHRIVGSSPSGFWVLTDGSPDLIAINPLTREKFSLPPLTSFPIVVRFDEFVYPIHYLIRPLETTETFEYSLKYMCSHFFNKVILIRDSQDPSKFLALAMPAECSDLAYCRQGDVLWRSVCGTHTYNEDTICFRGKVYLVDKCGSLAICDFSHDPDSPPVVEFIKSAQENPPLRHFVTHYLVDATDELLLVRRSVDLREKTWKAKFYVFKFDWSTKEWRSMKSLENRVLFLSPQYSFAVSSIAYPGLGKESIVCFKTDYVYGNTHSCEGKFEAVIYKMSGERIQEEVPFYNGKLLYPIWFAPKLL